MASSNMTSMADGSGGRRNRACSMTACMRRAYAERDQVMQGDSEADPRASITAMRRGASALVPLFDLKFLNEFAASGAETSNRRHYEPRRAVLSSTRLSGLGTLRGRGAAAACD